MLFKIYVVQHVFVVFCTVFAIFYTSKSMLYNMIFRVFGVFRVFLIKINPILPAK